MDPSSRTLATADAGRQRCIGVDATLHVRVADVVEIVPGLLDSAEPPSIGDACFNLTQRDLILEALDAAAADDDAFAERLAVTRARQGAGSFEGLFVKNLEHVRGDERDHIIISMTYGRTAEGKFHRRFGPLGQAGGGRRLNVLITRAQAGAPGDLDPPRGLPTAFVPRGDQQACTADHDGVAAPLQRPRAPPIGGRERHRWWAHDDVRPVRDRRDVGIHPPRVRPSEPCSSPGSGRQVDHPGCLLSERHHSSAGQVQACIGAQFCRQRRSLALDARHRVDRDQR